MRNGMCRNDCDMQPLEKEKSNGKWDEERTHSRFSCPARSLARSRNRDDSGECVCGWCLCLSWIVWISVVPSGDQTRSQTRRSHALRSIIFFMDFQVRCHFLSYDVIARSGEVKAGYMCERLLRNFMISQWIASREGSLETQVRVAITRREPRSLFNVSRTRPRVLRHAKMNSW